MDRNDRKRLYCLDISQWFEIGHEISRTGIEGTPVKIRSNSPKSLGRNKQQLYRVDHENSLFEDLL